MKKQTLSRLSRLILVGLLGGSTCESRAELILTPVAVDGQPAPGTTSGITFGGSNYKDVQINDAGEVMFTASIEGPGVFSTNRTGLWIGLPGALELNLREGDPAPGEAEGVVFQNLFAPVLGEGGAAIFYAALQGPGISDAPFTSGDDDTVWMVRPVSEAAVASQGRAGRAVRPQTSVAGKMKRFEKIVPALSDVGFIFGKDKAGNDIVLFNGWDPKLNIYVLTLGDFQKPHLFKARRLKLKIGENGMAGPRRVE